MRSHKLVAGIDVINEGLFRLGKWGKWLSQDTYMLDGGGEKSKLGQVKKYFSV